MGLLRLFFALSVLLGHISISLLPSPIYAVLGFYIISGFYMSLILNEKYTSTTTNITFYKKRFLRLLPTYWLLAIVHLVIALLFYYRQESNILFFDFNHFPPEKSITTQLFIIISNIIIWGQDLALFLGVSPDTGDAFFSVLSFAEEYPMSRYQLIPVAWSISTEFTFYIIAPFILRSRKKLVFLIFILSIISNIITNYYGLNNTNWRFRFFPSVLVFFLSGYYAYLIYTKIRIMKITMRYKHIVTIGTILLLSIICYTRCMSFVYWDIIHSIPVLYT